MKSMTERFRLLPLLSVILTGSLLAPSPASALTESEIKCRDAASRIARGALYTALQVRVNCVRRTAFGSFDPTINCMEDPEELGGPGTGDLNADRRLQDLAFSGERAGEVLARRCLDDKIPDRNVVPSDIGIDDACSPSSDDWADVGQCLVDIGMAAAKVYMPALNLPGPGPLPPSALACMDAINAQARRTLGAESRFRSLCFKEDDKLGGGALDCGATIMPPGTVESTGVAKFDKRLGEVYPKLVGDIRQFCDIPLETTGYDVITPDVTGGRFEGRITVWDIEEHINDRLAETVHLITFGDTGVEALFLGSQTGGFCGDGTQDAGEQCDDGNNFSCDGCDRDCTLPSCGNGAICDAEECDDGNNNSGDGCTATCISEICGNGVTNPGWDEDCDDAGFSFACDDDCTFKICGDALVNPFGETCDEGTGLPNNQAQNTPTCDSDCSAPSCPDGHHNPLNTNAPAPGTGEECDTGGNSLSCDANCTLASCGDGWTNPVRGEQCDDNNFSDSDDCPSSSTVPGSFCKTAFCGDGFQCTGGGCSSPEFCDDGTGVLGSAESATCDDDCSAVSCGDSNLNVSAGEQCDTGGAVGNTRPCTAGCQTATCGDGLTCSHGTCTTGRAGTPEGCDDADGDNNDPCTNDCEIATCGDTIVCNDPTCTTGPGGTPEQCDTGGNSPSCDSNCTTAGCGDSFHNPAAGEACDTGGNSATCDANCTLPSCGDGTLNIPFGEQCDNGGSNGNNRPCTAGCDAAFCGDGLTCSHGTCTSGPGGGSEQCDGGGETFACDTDCSSASCGDGELNATRGEVCDDDNLTNGDGCDNNCTLTACGNGVVTAGEVCDDGDLTSGDGCDSNCTPTACGNGIVTAGEVCDDGDLTSGDGCDSNCTLTACGNGIVTAGEQCDDSNVNNGDGCDSTCQIEP